MYFGELPDNITLVHTAALYFVSVKISVYLSVITRVLEQIFILSYNILCMYVSFSG